MGLTGIFILAPLMRVGGWAPSTAVKAQAPIRTAVVPAAQASTPVTVADDFARLRAFLGTDNKWNNNRRSGGSDAPWWGLKETNKTPKMLKVDNTIFNGDDGHMANFVAPKSSFELLERVRTRKAITAHKKNVVDMLKDEKDSRYPQVSLPQEKASFRRGWTVVHVSRSKGDTITPPD